MNIRSFLVAGIAVTAIGSLTACAMTPAGEGASQRNRSITAEELSASSSQMVYEALELLRPSWMSSRGVISATNSEEARANVYQNGVRVGDLEYLRQVYVVDVAELRYWPPGEASARFGMGNPRGVIEIILK
jgi:hypothetical protein